MEQRLGEARPVEQEHAKLGPISSSALSVIGALASGVGVVAFLVFVGGVVELARARGVGLSGPYVVSHVPRTELLASGADQLFDPFVTALLAVLIAAGYAWWSQTVQRPHWEWTGYGWGSEPSYWVWVWVRRLLVLVAAAGGIVLFRHEAGHPDPFHRGDREVAFAAAILVLIAAAVAIDRLAPPPGNRTQFSTARSIGYLSVVAATTVAFGSLLVFAHNEWRPQVRPLALIGTEYPKGLIGVYAGEDDAHIYVGIIRQPIRGIPNRRQTTRVIVVDRSEITALAVGGLFELHESKDKLQTNKRKLQKNPYDVRNAQLVTLERALLAELERYAASGP